MSRISVRGVMLSSVVAVLTGGIVAAGMAASPVSAADLLKAAPAAATATTGPSLATVQQAQHAVAGKVYLAEALAAARARQAAARHAQLVAAEQAKQAAAAAAAAAAARQAQLAAYTSQDPRAIAQGMLGQFGWDTSGQWSCLDNLWQRESGWNVYAQNPSGAYGIPQALPGWKMSSAGSDWRVNPATQIRWGLQYIASVYGTPCNAWYHDTSYGFY